MPAPLGRYGSGSLVDRLPSLRSRSTGCFCAAVVTVYVQVGESTRLFVSEDFEFSETYLRGEAEKSQENRTGGFTIAKSIYPSECAVSPAACLNITRRRLLLGRETLEKIF